MMSNHGKRASWLSDEFWELCCKNVESLNSLSMMAGDSEFGEIVGFLVTAVHLGEQTPSEMDDDHRSMITEEATRLGLVHAASY